MYGNTHDRQKMETAQWPHTDEATHKVWDVHTMEYYSIKRNELMMDLTIWINLKNIKQKKP